MYTLVITGEQGDYDPDIHLGLTEAVVTMPTQLRMAGWWLGLFSEAWSMISIHLEHSQLTEKVKHNT